MSNHRGIGSTELSIFKITRKRLFYKKKNSKNKRETQKDPCHKAKYYVLNRLWLIDRAMSRLGIHSGIFWYFFFFIDEVFLTPPPGPTPLFFPLINNCFISLCFEFNPHSIHFETHKKGKQNVIIRHFWVSWMVDELRIQPSKQKYLWYNLGHSSGSSTLGRTGIYWLFWNWSYRHSIQNEDTRLKFCNVKCFKSIFSFPWVK